MYKEYQLYNNRNICNVPRHTVVASRFLGLLRAPIRRHRLQQGQLLQVDRLLAPPDRGLVDRHPLLGTHLRVRGADGRQGPHRFGPHLRPQRRFGTFCSMKGRHHFQADRGSRRNRQPTKAECGAASLQSRQAIRTCRMISITIMYILH